MVPRDKAWPGAKKKEPIKLRVPLSASNSDDAGEEDASGESPAAARGKSTEAGGAKATSTASIRVRSDKAARSDKLAAEAKRRRKLERQVREQDEYIAKLKAKYAPREHKHASKARHEAADSDSDSGGSAPSNPTTEDASQASDASTSGVLTDASEEVRHMIKSLKIKAAGTEDAAFNPSEDSQLLASKENGESYATIAKSMGRTKKQVQKRHRELMELGKTAETAGTGGAGETTGDPTTGTDNDVPADAFGGLFDLGGLQARLEATAAEQARAQAQAKESGKEGGGSDDQVASNAPRTSPVGILKTEAGGKKKDKKKKPKLTPPATVGGESGYESGSEDAPARAFIGSYARHLLADKSTIPEADDKFDDDDCILMAVADARRKGDRWKQMQADFVNLTGRMVPTEVLKYKFGEGEKPKGY